MATPQQVLDINRAAWERYVDGRWSTPVSPEKIAAARRGEWEEYLIESKPVPRDWFPELRGADVLALAAGGRRQGDRAGRFTGATRTRPFGSGAGPS